MDRILTTHVGSLIRPQELVGFFDAIERGEGYDEIAHEACLKRSVAEVVRQQVDSGVDVVDDGEFGHVSFISYVFERIAGIEVGQRRPDELDSQRPTRDRQAFPEFYAEEDARNVAAGLGRRVHILGRKGVATSELPSDASARPVWLCTGPLVYESAPLERDIANLSAALENVHVTDAFLPAIAPATLYHLFNRYYGSDEEFMVAVADALHAEYKAIVDAGFQLQIDDPAIAHDLDKFLAAGESVEDYRRWAQLRIDALNHALRGIPEDRVRYHICWGSWHGPHLYDPPLSQIVEFVLQVHARYYSIEQANGAHEHEWRLWEDVKLPEGKVLVPGVVTHHTNVVERPELVAERLVRLARLVGRENVIGGTDCGFAQSAYTERVHPSIQWAKLRALSQGAELATKELWGRLPS